jgi:hypothetical protein
MITKGVDKKGWKHTVIQVCVFWIKQELSLEAMAKLSDFSKRAHTGGPESRARGCSRLRMFKKGVGGIKGNLSKSDRRSCSFLVFLKLSFHSKTFACRWDRKQVYMSIKQV